jgi:general secretion pathway protein F
VRNGVPLLTALGIGRNVLGEPRAGRDVETAADEVKNGIACPRRWRVASASRGWPADDFGGRGIRCARCMLVKTAETFEQETALSLDRMLAALVPVVTVVLAAVIGVVVMSVLLPLYDLTNAIG